VEQLYRLSALTAIPHAVHCLLFRMGIAVSIIDAGRVVCTNATTNLTREINALMGVFYFHDTLRNTNERREVTRELPERTQN